jgi:hypothetical protein
MSDPVTPEFLARLIGGEIEVVEGGEPAFDDADFEDDADDIEFEG